MGGLVARYCLEVPGMAPCGITDVFQIGTPNHGSSLAQDYDLLELLVRVTAERSRGISQCDISDGLGEAADDLAPDSEFLAMLNALPRQGGVRYHVGIGSHSLIAAGEREQLLLDVKRVLVQRAVFRMPRNAG